MIGLRRVALQLFRSHVPAGATVLDVGSRDGIWPNVLKEASFDVEACDAVVELANEVFPHHQADLNGPFSAAFTGRRFDAVSLIEAIEHLENPRQVIRQAAALLKPGGILLLTTPNAAGLYSRIRFFLTGKMAMFTDGSYEHAGHITPVTWWQMDKIARETGLEVLEVRFYTSRFFPPRSLADVARGLAWVVRPFMFGTVGGQTLLCVLKRP
jgi:2-polyprenyl-3-methyl-5-hydroxy-6-metoxy-1,4-benzoquinol methylase